MSGTAPPAPPGSRAPIFVLGNPRSGTTLLRLMLTCHPNIVIPPECGFAVWLYPRFQGWDAANAEAMLERFVPEVLGCRKIETWQLAEDELRGFLAAARPTSYSRAASLVYEHYGRAQGRSFTRWGDKNNFYIHHLDTVEEIFPDAVFVHLVRDGRNVACSYKWLHEQALESPYAPRLPWEIGEIAREWRDNNERIGAFLGRLGRGRSTVVRFEELVADPEGQLRRLCAALGEELDPAMLRYHEANQERQLEPRELMAWKKKTLEPPRTSEIDRFARELSPREVADFESVAGATLERYGFGR